MLDTIPFPWPELARRTWPDAPEDDVLGLAAQLSWITPGAVAPTVLWLGASLIFKVYIANFTDYNGAYGTVGGVIVLLLWLFISGLAILVGAELNAEIEHASSYGKAPGQKNAQGKLLLGRRAARVFRARQSQRQATHEEQERVPSSQPSTEPRPRPAPGAAFVGLVVALVAAACSVAASQAEVNADAAILQDFKQRLHKYGEVHREAAKGAAKPKESEDPAKIILAQDALAARIRAARPTAKQGDIFTSEIGSRFRQLLAPQLKGEVGRDAKALMKDDAPAAGSIPFKVNAKYPEGAPVPTVPASLLLRLPTLPKPLEYRIIGRHLLLLDTDAGIIVDYLPNAIS